MYFSHDTSYFSYQFLPKKLPIYDFYSNMVVMLLVLAFKYLSHELSKSMPIRSSTEMTQEKTCIVETVRETPSKPLKKLLDEEIVVLCNKKQLPLHSLELALNDHKRAVKVRRMFIQEKLSDGFAMEDLSWEDYDYGKVLLVRTITLVICWTH